MFEFLLFGSMIWFWILFFVVSVLIIISVEDAYPTQATVGVLVFFGVFSYWGTLPGGETLLDVIVANPWYVIPGIFAFFLVGTVWCVVKWWFYVRSKAEDLRSKVEAIQNWNDNNEPRVQMNMPRVEKPSTVHNKKRILTWMCFWPYSMLWTLINDPIRKLYREIYKRISGTLQGISDNAFKDFETEEEKPQRPIIREEL